MNRDMLKDKIKEQVKLEMKKTISPQEFNKGEEVKEITPEQYCEAIDKAFESETFEESFRGALAGVGTGLTAAATSLGMILGGAGSAIGSIGATGTAAGAAGIGVGASFGILTGGAILFVAAIPLAGMVKGMVDKSITKGSDKAVLDAVRKRDQILGKIAKEEDREVQAVLTRKLKDATKNLMKAGAKLLDNLVKHRDKILESVTEQEYKKFVETAMAAKNGTLTNIRELVGKTISTRQ